MNSSIASIAISPIITSRDAPSSPSDLRLSSNNDNVDVSSYTYATSPPQHGPRKNQYSMNYHQHQHQHCHDSYHSHHSHQDNDENMSMNSRVALSTSFRTMSVINIDDSDDHDDHDGEYEVENTNANMHSRNIIYIDDVDAPSDERDDDQNNYANNANNVHHNNSNNNVYEMSNYNDEYQRQTQYREEELQNQYRQAEHQVEVEQQLEQHQVEHQDQQEETDEERRRREEEESENLARQLMAEEAMASYAQSTNFLRSHANEYSEEDLRALEALIAEEDPTTHQAAIDVDLDVDADIDGVVDGEIVGEESADLSYETLLRLGERMGDVKSERWAMKAKQEIAKLKKVNFTADMARGKDENDCAVKCLICQFQYEEGDVVAVLPCGHNFHHDCVDQWLLTKDHCPYCRQSIVN
jgi:hypothetical protein